MATSAAGWSWGALVPVAVTFNNPPLTMGGDPVEVSRHTFGMMLDLARMAKPDPDGWRPRLFEEIVESVRRDEEDGVGGHVGSGPVLTLVPPE